MANLAWITPGCRAFISRSTFTSRSRSMHSNGKCLSAAASQSHHGSSYNPDIDNNNNNNNIKERNTNINDELQKKLRQLALLNGGNPLNPRSPRQVSNLLYGNNGNFHLGSAAVNNAWTGPTDKATLQKIVLRDSDNDSDSDVSLSSNGKYDDDGDHEKQKQVATLVLQCRELLASVNSSNGKNKSQSSSSSSETFASKAARGVRHNNNNKQPKIQVANFSNLSSEKTDNNANDDNNNNVDVDVDIIHEVRQESNSGDVQEEPIIVSLIEDKDTDTDDNEGAIITNPVVAAQQPSQSSYSMSPYERIVMDLFPNIDNNVGNGEEQNNRDTIDPYWIEPLLALTKSSSRSLVRQLQATSCPMGYDPSASSITSLISNKNTTTSTTTSSPKRATGLLSYIRTQKSQYYPDAVALIRVGDFYESFGIDAIMLAEHCGLNFMAGKARAGCPWRNVQATLDGLTNAGYRVAVYEEWNGNPEDCPGLLPSDDGTRNGKAASKLKPRYMAQVVSSANPTYMHGLVLNDDSSAADDVPTPHNGDLSSSSPGRSYVGVIETRAGYSLVEISAEERTVVVSERLTAEAVSCRLVAYPPADPLFYVPPFANEVGGSASASASKKGSLDRLPFLPWTQQRQQTAATSLAASAASRRYNLQGGTMVGKVRVKTLPPSLVVAPKPGLTDVERAKQTIVSAFLRIEDDSTMSRSPPVEDSASASLSPSRKRERNVVTHDDFVVVASSLSASSSDTDDDTQHNGSSTTVTVTATHPLHLETATQLGLMSDPAIPPLISSLLPDSAPASSQRFLRRWLLIPPPPDVADAMSQLVGTLKDGEDCKALPSLNAPPLTGKVISLIRAGQASAAVYREILSALDAASEILLLDGDHDEPSGIVSPLLKILHHDTGTEASDYRSLRARFVDAMKVIEGVVCTHNLERPLHTSSNFKDDIDSNQDYISYFGDAVPPAFFERNEAIWRGRVKARALEHAHTVPLAAKRLTEAIAMDFWGVETIAWVDDNGTDHDIIDLSDAKESKNPVMQDIFNNIIAIKAIPSWAAKEMKDKSAESDEAEEEHADGKSTRYFHPRDRFNKVLKTRYTTERVQEAISEYVEACDNARAEVERVLTRLSWNLVDEGHLPAILQASHLNLILSTAAHHAASSNARGWSTAAIYDDDLGRGAGSFQGLWPYWMDRSNSVSNTFDLDGLFLLTAPNMSGKSTLMRSTAAAAHLINSGLCAPVGHGSALRRFDSIFVRGASADVPTEDKSAFGAEMGDVAALLRSCGERSVIFVDEIGRGTSPKDGTSLAGAILEQMAELRMSGMFATHLHGMLDLPFSSEAQERLKRKRMAIVRDDEDGSDELRWTYILEDGVCTNSLALLTAAKFGLPASILKRAEELSEHWDTESSKDDDVNIGLASNDSLTNGHNTSHGTNGIQHIIAILEETAGDKCSSIRIPPSYMPPPSLEGSSCVYILQIGGEDSKLRYYVGETDRLSQRIKQHRSKGKDWSSLSAIAISIDGGKSIARNVESLVIQRMAKSGFDLISVTDGLTVRSLGRAE